MAVSDRNNLAKDAARFDTIQAEEQQTLKQEERMEAMLHGLARYATWMTMYDEQLKLLSQRAPAESTPVVQWLWNNNCEHIWEDHRGMHGNQRSPPSKAGEVIQKVSTGDSPGVAPSGHCRDFDGNAAAPLESGSQSWVKDPTQFVLIFWFIFCHELTIPYIFPQAGSIFCDEIVTDGDYWPKTPAGATVTNNTCAEGRVGYKSRTCIGPPWQDVYNNCINQGLNTALQQATKFQKGLGSTPEVAMTIFEGLFNSSVSASSNNIADINASIKVLHFMATASSYSNLPEEVLPNFINASSNLLEMTWNVPPLILYNVSSAFLQSVDDLVKNIKVNTSQGVNSTNIDLRFCSTSKCALSVFDVGVEMIISNGILKTAVVRNLTNKLRNNYKHTKPSTLLLSATLQDNNDSSTNIILDFPDDWQTYSKPFCVFWNTTGMDWSDVGCTVNISDENHTVCVCNHLTSFSVLISKDEVSPFNTILEIITNVGLAVSIFSLMIFLTIECLVWSNVVKTNLAHFRHTAMVNIATFLLLADISFLASTRPGILPDIWCLILTICKHLFYLAMFCWMLCLSIMLVHQLIFVFSPLSKRVFMVFSSIVGYILPLLIVGSSYAYSIYMGKPYYNKETCWLIFNNGLDSSIHAFLLPVGTIILTNIFSMMVIIFTLVKSWVPSTNKADDKMTAKSMLKVVVVLTPIFGITWIIGFFQLLYPEIDPLVFCFTILNSFQGIFILLTGCFTEQKIREELYKMITRVYRS
ncbi:adhesion G-protein coupled receptor F3-like [Betta splendens]|uniref:Adhesion G-protein coupled receptor F3-like n=1 Tax=Betta splendens TaxID=158456 RepID=A0A8M1HAX0_BETSP|nr:adhesion G-protein coupled receptor F3-like [Betta splendens]